MLKEIEKGKMDLGQLIASAESLKTSGNLDACIALYTAWLQKTSSPLRYVALFNQAVSLSQAGREAEAVAAYEESIALKHDFPEARVNLGLTLEKQGRPQDSLAHWKVVYESPGTPMAMLTTALNHTGRLLEETREYEDAEAALARSLSLNPNQPDVLQHWIHLRQKQCKWPVYDAPPKTSKADLLLATSPLAMLAEADDPALQLLSAQSFAHRKLTFPEVRLCEGRRYHHRRLRVGYLSSDFCVHAVGLLLAELFENHNRAQFELYGFCVSKEDGTAHRQRIVNAFEHFERVGHLSDEQIAKRVLECEIDLLIDLNGLSSGTRVGVLGYRPAPVQATWLGFIGTTGLPYIDFVIADAFAIPPELASFYREKPLYLPHSFLPSDSRREVGPKTSRAEHSLPEDQFVFASFNNIYKLNPQMFETWTDILKRVPNSVLWLLDDNRWATANLTAFAESQGVDPKRLIFAGPLSGRTFVSRMGGSLLTAHGLPELIAYSHSEYADKAVDLALHPGRIAQLRKRLLAARAEGKATTAKEFAHNLEQLFLQATGREAVQPPEKRIKKTPAEQTLLVRGWRDINHSYSLVNQFQLLHLLGKENLHLLHEDLPYHSPNWSAAQNSVGFDSETTQKLSSIPAYHGEEADVVLSISSPFSLYRGRAKKVVTFMVTEFGLDGSSFAPDSQNPAAFSEGRNWVVTPSQWAKHKLEIAGIDPARIAVIPHGVDRRIFRAPSEQERAIGRSQLGLAPGEFAFLNVGGAFWNKGGDLLLRAFAHVRKLHPHVKLVVKDNRGLYNRTTDHLVSTVQESHPGLLTPEILQGVVVLPTALTMDQLRLLYGSTDAYVSPYRAEGFNLPVLEAMACGLKVIVTEGGATDDFFFPEVCTGIKSSFVDHKKSHLQTRGDFLEPDFEDLTQKMLAAVEAGSSHQNAISPALDAFLNTLSWESATEKLHAFLFDAVPQEASVLPPAEPKS
ncbi:MAG: glycosyltransferase, partial [Verrucomicrobia bacterium]|nr:glycosyltransferase [Verrucomicrobiota bacterium]